jgi:hypothetical protein
MKKRSQLLNASTYTFVLVKNYIGQPELQEWELAMEQEAEIQVVIIEQKF